LTLDKFVKCRGLTPVYSFVQDNGIVVEGGKLYPLVEVLEQLLSSEIRLEAMKKKSIEIIQNFKPGSLVKQISFFQE